MSKWLTPGVLTALIQVERLLKDGVSTRIPPEEIVNFQLAEYIFALRKDRLTGFEDTFAYQLNSKFTFGKFKGCELRNVWKVSPDYVEWCMLNAVGFILSPESLKTISIEPVFQNNYLATLITDNGCQVTIDLRQLPLNAHGFRVAPSEEKFVISEDAVAANQVKLKTECHPLTIRKGSNWGDGNALISLTRRSSILIQG